MTLFGLVSSEHSSLSHRYFFTPASRIFSSSFLEGFLMVIVLEFPIAVTFSRCKDTIFFRNFQILEQRKQRNACISFLTPCTRSFICVICDICEQLLFSREVVVSLADYADYTDLFIFAVGRPKSRDAPLNINIF